MRLPKGRIFFCLFSDFSLHFLSLYKYNSIMLSVVETSPILPADKIKFAFYYTKYRFVLIYSMSNIRDPSITLGMTQAQA